MFDIGQMLNTFFLMLIWIELCKRNAPQIEHHVETDEEFMIKITAEGARYRAEREAREAREAAEKGEE